MDDTSTVTGLLYDYYTAFSSLDPEVIAPYFHEPCILISAQGVTAALTHDDVKDVSRTIAEGLRPRGYKKSDLRALQIKRMSDNAILASGIAVRSRSDGSELERVGVTYLMHKSNDRWKIAVTVIHDAVTVIERE